MKSKFFLTALLASTIGAQALASLPDEINYRPYERDYDRLVLEVNTITANLESLENSLADSYNEESSSVASIESMENENLRLEREISIAQSNLESLLDRSDDLEIRIRELRFRQNRLEAKRDKLQRALEQERRRLAPIREKIARIERRFEIKKSELQKAKTQLERVRSKAESLKRELNALKTDGDSLKTKISNLKAKLQNIDSEIASTKSKLSSMGSKISSAKNTLSSEKSKKQSLESELEQLKQQLNDVRQADRTDPRVRELRGQVAAKSREVKAQAGVVQAAKSKLDNLKGQRDGLKTKITRLENDKSSLPAKISRAESNLKSKKAQIGTKKVEVSKAEDKRREKRAEVDALGAETNRIQTGLFASRDELNRERRRSEELRADLNDTITGLSDVNSKLASRINENERVLDEASGLERKIPRLKRDIQSNDSQIASTQRALRSIRGNIANLKQDIRRVEIDQSQAISERDGKYQEYIGRHNLYRTKLNDAVSLGQSQSGVANNVGVVDSNKYVELRSSELGSQIALELASSQSNFWSSIRAEIDGYKDGYSIGHASDSDRVRGEEEGNIAGIKAAQDYATRVLKPEFFNEIFSREIEGSSFKNNSDQVSMQEIFTLVEGQQKSMESLLSGVSPVSSAEIKESLEIETSLDESITKFQKNLAQTSKQATDMALASNAYQNPTAIPYGQVNCSGVYKGVQEFRDACNRSYLQNFKSQYLDTFFENFESQYQNLYEGKLEGKRSSLISSLYEAGFKRFYPVAEASGIEDGKAAVYVESFASAKEQAYVAELPSATAKAQAQASVEVSDWITNNATLTLKGSEILGEELRGNSVVTLKIKIKNISPQNLTKPVKVVLTELGNLVVDQKTYFIKKVSGNTTSDFTDIMVKIKSSVRSNQTIAIGGKVILPGGKYNAQRVETFSATAVTTVNPMVTPAYKYITSPRVLTRFRRRTLIHNFDMTVTPTIETVRSGYTIKMEAVSGYEGMINLKNTSIVTGAIIYGSTKNARFQYTFPRASRGKLVKIKLTFAHKGKIIKSEVVELKPF